MKILIISKYASSKEFGFETRLFALSRIFAKKGHGVTIISSDSNHWGLFPVLKKTYSFLIIEAINLILIKTKKYKRTISLNRVLSWIDFELKLLFLSKKKLEKPDVIIVSSLSLLTILNGIHLKKRFKCKLIFEIRDIWPLTLIEEGGYSRYNPFVRVLSWVEKKGYSASDLIIGTMPNLKEHVELITGKQINCSCVPFGFKFEDNEENLAESQEINLFNIPSNKFVIGYAGSIGLSNGLDIFIEAIKEFKNRTNLYFVLVGDGGLKQKYMSYLEDCNNVKFIQKVERNQVKNILAKCDLLYFSSLKSNVWNYGWSPNKLIDYMISGRPVLASYSGFPSMINEAACGIIIPAEEKNSLMETIIKFSLMPAEELNAMGERGKKWIINNRRWETLADNYLSIISDLISIQK